MRHTHVHVRGSRCGCACGSSSAGAGHHPILCITPPHMLEHMSRAGGPLAQRALRTLVVSSRFAGRRQAIGGMPFAAAAAVAGVKRRTIYHANNTETLPGVLVRGEGDPATGDLAVDEAYDGSGATYDFYRQTFNRNSIDNHGMRLDSTVHYGQDYDNAFWNGSQMVYGDGDGQVFNRFTIALDVIAHELTHGVTEFSAALEYYGEPGALNESFSDCFGSMIKQHVLKQRVDQADWLIGAGLLRPNINGRALRDMANPGTAYDDPVIGTDPQPKDMDGFYGGPSDNGGVHINSGIPNRAFYIAAKAMGGYAWETVGPVWYRTLTERLHQQSTFLECAEATVSVASEIAGAGSELTDAVREGWRTVKVLRAAGGVQKGRTGSGTRRVVATTGNGAGSRKPRRPVRRRQQAAAGR